uniref:Putative secreted protein n=1 Tax=Anopheles marajoara TaxID=58244 RepID=A0A2M4CEI0_9DIPT
MGSPMSFHLLLLLLLLLLHRNSPTKSQLPIGGQFPFNPFAAHSFLTMGHVDGTAGWLLLDVAVALAYAL